MLKIFITAVFLFPGINSTFYLPINCNNRKSSEGLFLTDIGEFGVLRKARPEVPAHYHTGIDIKRPGKNYRDEPIFPITDGVVISKRSDGPYAQLIIEHDRSGVKFWTVYEHVAGIKVNIHEPVTHDKTIARFMNKEELNKYGWQFDHFHFEVLKVAPVKLKRDNSSSQRHFASYSLVCKSKEDLKKYFHNPIEFLKGQN